MSQDNDGPIIRLEPGNGVALIPKPTALTRLHYFDGKFLRAADLRAEQDYQRALVQRSNQAGGWGVVHGFHVHLGAGASLVLHPGLAIDPKGRVLSLPGPDTVSVGIETLVTTSRPEGAVSPAGPSGGAGFGGCAIPPSDGYVDPIAPSDLYLIVICHVEAACGTDEQFGTLCVDACARETDYAYLVEGVEVRALPLSALSVPKPEGWLSAHGNLRSRVASAFFAEEPEQVSLISGDGLRDPAWCFGAEPGAQTCVPLGVLAYSGGVVRFFDPWISRRERMEGPPRRSWAWRMRMRPWSVFLAQVLQFQCHLVEALGLTPASPGVDPCADEHALIDETATALEALRAQYQALLAQLGDGAASAGLLDALEALIERLQAAQAARADVPDDHILLKRGILELPSAGYLPVDAQSDTSVNAQVRALLGEGVDLRFCVVRPDYVAHALEEAQHIDRVSLTRGLADPEALEAVDILVPDGIILETTASIGSAWRARGSYRESFPPAEPPYGAGGNAIDAWVHGMVVNPGDRPPVKLAGMGRSRISRDGIANAHFAGTGEFPLEIRDYDPATGEQLGVRIIPVEVAAWLGMTLDASPFGLAIGQSTSARLRGIAALREDEGAGAQIALQGSLTITSRESSERVTGRLSVQGGRSELRGGGEGLFTTFDVELGFRRLGDGGSFIMEADSAQAGQIFSQAEWSGTPRVMRVLFAWLHMALGNKRPAKRIGVIERANFEGNLELEARQPSQPPFVVEVELTRDGRVERADDVDRQRAERAIEVIAQEMREPSFQTEAQALLFPPMSREGTLIVQATRDWVLFHRRRDRTCAVAAPPPPTPPVTPVRYEVLVVQDADSGADFEKAVIEALAGSAPGGDPLAEVTRIGSVEFMPGRSALWSDAEALRARWGEVDPGHEASLAVIGGADALPTVGRGRLDQVIGALSTVSDALPQPTDFSEAIVQVLEGSTARYPSVGHDGFILFVVTAAADPVTECHEVYAVGNLKTWRLMRDMSVAEIIGLDGVAHLGHVEFEAGNDEPLEPLAAPASGPVITGVIFYRGPLHDDPVPPRALATRRAVQVALDLDPDFRDPEGVGLTHVTEPLDDTDDCRWHTFLLTGPREINVAVYELRGPQPNGPLADLETAWERGDLTLTWERGTNEISHLGARSNGDPDATLRAMVGALADQPLWASLAAWTEFEAAELDAISAQTLAYLRTNGLNLPTGIRPFELGPDVDFWPAGQYGSDVRRFVLLIGPHQL